MAKKRRELRTWDDLPTAYVSMLRAMRCPHGCQSGPLCPCRAHLSGLTCPLCRANVRASAAGKALPFPAPPRPEPLSTAGASLQPELSGDG